MNTLYHVVNSLPPIANAFAGAVTTSVINMKGWGHASFLIQCGIGPVGTARITVEACADIVPTAVIPLTFYYQECIGTDVFGPIIKTTDTTGFITSAASGKVYKVEVDPDTLASTGYGYIRVKSTEVVVGAITGGIVAVLTEGRFQSETPDSTLV